MVVALALLATAFGAPRAEAKVLLGAYTDNQSIDSGASYSTIELSSRRIVKDVNVRLYGVFHTYPDDLDVTLEHGGKRVPLMSDVGGGFDISSVTFTIDDEALAYFPDNDQLGTATYRPTDIDESGNDVSRKLRTFDGQRAKGDWRLEFADDLPNDTAHLDGWDLTVKVR